MFKENKKVRNKVRNYLITIIMLALFLIPILPFVSAHCPLCTTGAAVGVATARFYGVDDSIVGLFLGAVIVSSALWFNKWLRKKINFPLQEALIVIFSFLILVVPFYMAGLITDFKTVKSMPENYSILGFGVFGIDKLLFGTLLGSLAIWGAFSLSNDIKNRRGKVLWPYQGLSFMFIVLIILSIIFLLITK